MTNQAIKIEQLERSEFLDDVLTGLSQEQKTLPCKYFYNEEGSTIYDRICHLDEYYPSRTEIDILTKYASEITGHFHEDTYLLEYGSGNSNKTRALLNKGKHIKDYSPIDISGEHLLQSVSDLTPEYPELHIHPIVADYTKPFQVPDDLNDQGNRVVFYPGSSIGNFEPEQAIEILKDIRTLAGPNGILVIGADLIKPIPILESAYNDREGVTAEFNLNLLSRINQELNANFDLSKFKHRAIFNQELKRVEMHLISLTGHTVTVAGHSFNFDSGESIHTESSHKYSISGFKELAKEAGWKAHCRWTDDQCWFSVQLLK